jgi:hypothetical protein
MIEYIVGTMMFLFFGFMGWMLVHSMLNLNNIKLDPIGTYRKLFPSRNTKLEIENQLLREQYKELYSENKKLIADKEDTERWLQNGMKEERKVYDR